VAAHAGALGASLVEMVTGLTLGKEKYKEFEGQMRSIRAEAGDLRKLLTKAVDEDAAAYSAVMAAHGLPKSTADEKLARDAAVQAAMLDAARVPLETARHAVRVMELARECVEKGNLNAISDAVSGAAMARAALTAAAYNVRINLYGYPDKAASEPLLGDLRQLLDFAGELESSIERTMGDRARLA
jgi:formiminotetrahydrofolate cyclodeaminase